MNIHPHTFIIAALSADGFIAKTSDHISISWTSKEDRAWFTETTKRAGVVVMGGNTFRTMKKPLADRLNIVYSRTQKYEGVEVTSREPRELLEDLQKRGFTEVAIIGGSEINTLFLEAGVVDTLYLTVEPILFGRGITLFSRATDTKLTLIKMDFLGEQSLLLEYRLQR